ncbi:SgcJ/EcaC family oxidoreductase [Nocardia sp. NPDC050712]|uniref:SgcJ/EcaC family oxidoreductase n=1 Tax=Nocardia sp. NPDC050712 TaxID=3155518 RepID=UPI0033F2C08C
MTSEYRTAQQADTAAIRAVFDEVNAAWAAADAEAYGALFTADATYTAFFGTQYRGRADIVASHRALSGSFLKGTELAGELIEIRFLTAEVAVVIARGDTYKSKRPERLTKVQTYTLVRRDGRWLIAAFQNTKRNPLLEFVTFRTTPAARPAAQR